MTPVRYAQIDEASSLRITEAAIEATNLSGTAKAKNTALPPRSVATDSWANSYTDGFHPA